MNENFGTTGEAENNADDARAAFLKSSHYLLEKLGCKLHPVLPLEFSSHWSVTPRPVPRPVFSPGRWSLTEQKQKVFTRATHATLWTPRWGSLALSPGWQQAESSLWLIGSSVRRDSKLKHFSAMYWLCLVLFLILLGSSVWRLLCPSGCQPVWAFGRRWHGSSWRLYPRARSPRCQQQAPASSKLLVHSETRWRKKKKKTGVGWGGVNKGLRARRGRSGLLPHEL